MNVIQRKALAESVGVNVEELSRLVRNRTSAAPTGALNKGMSGQIELLNAIYNESVRTSTNTGVNAEKSSGLLSHFKQDW